MLCKEIHGRARHNFLTEILYLEVKKQIIKSKVKADVDNVNHHFSKKHVL